MIHEAGHAFHSLYCGHLELIDERDYPIEFAEVASMSMELLTQPWWANSTRMRRRRKGEEDHLEGVVFLLPWIATIDSFQHWIYANPGHSREKSRGVALNKGQIRIRHELDWSYRFQRGFLAAAGPSFRRTFYYIEYE